MIDLDINAKFFFELVRAGLWTDVDLNLNANVNPNHNKKVDWGKVYQFAEEQSVVGLVLAGIEWFKVHDSRFTIPQELLLQWIGEVQILEQQNKEMNSFIEELIERLRKADIYTLLVKGQGIAQCYERPLWRTCGDVDLYLSDSNYEAAKIQLTPLASGVNEENKKKRCIEMTIDSWLVELHGTMHGDLSTRINKELDTMHNRLFDDNEVRIWYNGEGTVYLPSPDNDIIIVFTHFLQHFFIEGVGLRQICDWCRLLWTYKDSLNHGLLESRIRKMGLMTEWKAFAALAVDTLGMPREAMPFYDSEFKNKGRKVLERVMKCGNMGHNNDLSYRAKYSGMTYKLVALWRRLKDFADFTKIFPVDAPKFFVHYVFRKI